MSGKLSPGLDWTQGTYKSLRIGTAAGKWYNTGRSYASALRLTVNLNSPGIHSGGSWQELLNAFTVDGIIFFLTFYSSERKSYYSYFVPQGAQPLQTCYLNISPLVSQNMNPCTDPNLPHPQRRLSHLKHSGQTAKNNFFFFFFFTSPMLLTLHSPYCETREWEAQQVNGASWVRGCPPPGFQGAATIHYDRQHLPLHQTEPAPSAPHQDIQRVGRSAYTVPFIPNTFRLSRATL